MREPGEPGEPAKYDEAHAIEPAAALAVRRAGRARRTDWSPADWRAVYDERAGILEFDAGVPRLEAERAAFLEVAVQWVEAHPAVDVLPSAEAWPIARAGLGAKGIEA